jgi:hypothetical protein
VVVIVLVILAATGVFSKDGPPLIETVMERATVIDVATDTRELWVTPEEGGLLEGPGFVLEVPAGAVDQPAPLTVAELLEPFGLDRQGPPTDGTAHAVCVGPIVDVGPEGTSFDKPVTVTIAYDESRLPPGFPESEVAIAYWNGAAWVGVRGAVDTERDTVTIRLERFDGLIETTVAGLIFVGSVIIAEGVYLYSTWSNPETVMSDPITQKRAADWITPGDPTVNDWARRAVFVDDAEVDATNAQLAVDDPAVDEWAKAGRRFSVGFKQPDGSVLTLAQGYSSATGANWQKPAQYFTAGNLRGDCTDVTNGVVSVLRNRGYQAKGVFGYAGDVSSPHVWGETVLGGRPYLVDEDGVLWPLEKGIQNIGLLRAASNDTRNAMWDETGQQPYEADWWLRDEPTSTTTGDSTISTDLESTTTTFIEGTVPTESGYTVEDCLQVGRAGDPHDLRIFVTSTRTYDYEGRSRTSVAVFEYLVIDGKVSEKVSRWLYSADVPSDSIGEALSGAAEQIRRTIAEEGLTAGWPVS